MMDISKNTALERLEEFVHKIPDNNAVISEPDEKLTFRELWDLSGKIYAWLKGKGIGAEDVVMYCLPRGLMLYACMVGTMRAGAAFVLSETQNDPERTEYIRKDSHCKLFVDEGCFAVLYPADVRKAAGKNTLQNQNDPRMRSRLRDLLYCNLCSKDYLRQAQVPRLPAFLPEYPRYW